MNVIVVLAGLLVGFAGRSLFWLAVGLVGFLFGVGLGEAWFANQPAWLIALSATLIGLVGMILAIVFERVAIALAGFYAAAYVALMVSRQLGYESVPAFVPLGLGVIGAGITALLTDWAIILLTALSGSAAIVSVIDLAPFGKTLVLAVFVVTGSLVQYAMMARHRRGA